MMADKKSIETVAETVIQVAWLVFIYKMFRRII